MADFNPRSREGSDCTGGTSIATNGISIHAPARGATKHAMMYLAKKLIFQSTLPRGERPTRIMTVLQRSKHFNPRSREGSDGNNAWYSASILISIHAPARGATLTGTPISGTRMISIHAPARGATYIQDILKANRLFQSTLPRGERRGNGRITRTFTGISIHAPARGATNIIKPSVIDSVFQSTLPRGERLMRHPSCMPVSTFQSTLPRGERLPTQLI